MPLMIMGAVGAGTSLLGGLFGSSAASQAAQEQAQAEGKAASYLEGQETTGLQNFSPYLSAGSTATTSLANLLGTPGQGLLTPWTQQFTAPTAAQAAATPGYQFQLQQGLSAAQNSAAGQGGLLSGRTLADLNNYAQGTASTNYQNVFNNDLTQYNTAYNSFLNNQNNEYSRLMGMSGQGLSAAGSAGQFMTGMGGDIASLIAGQGAAQAAGTIGSANAWSNAIGGVGSSISNGLALNYLNGNNNFITGTPVSGGSLPFGGGMGTFGAGAPNVSYGLPTGTGPMLGAPASPMPIFQPGG